MIFSALVAGLIVLSVQPAHSWDDVLRRINTGIPFSQADVLPLAPVRGVPVKNARRVANPLAPKNTERVQINLNEIFNQHLKRCESFEYEGEKIYLGTQVNVAGDAYLSVRAQGGEDPLFFKFEYGMHDYWRGSGPVYSATLDASIFHKRFNNFLVIKDYYRNKKIYRKRLADFFFFAYQQGQEVTIKGKTYRLFYSYDLDASQSPAVFDKFLYGICLLHDQVDGNYHDFKSFPIARQNLLGGQPVAYELYDGQVLYFHLAEDLSTLTISD